MKNVHAVVIDDNVNLVEMIKEYFSSHEIISIDFWAYDGIEGIKLLDEKREHYDIIILDLIMPNKDGMYVLEEMKKRGIDKKVIVATSYNTGEVIRDVSEYGVNYFILKPFELSDLEKRILDSFKNRQSKNKNIDFYNNNLKISITKILHELEFHHILKDTNI